MSALVIGKKCIQVIKPLVVMKTTVREAERREVVLMAISEGYAMVRRPRCAPYVCLVKELVAMDSGVNK